MIAVYPSGPLPADIASRKPLPRSAPWLLTGSAGQSAKLGTATVAWARAQHWLVTGTIGQALTSPE